MFTSFARAPRFYARLAGVLYLAIIALGLFGEAFVRGTLVVPGDPAGTAAAIANAPMLWRIGIAGDLVMHVLDLPVLVILYLLLRPVGKGLAIFATATNLVQTAVLAANKLTLLVPVILHENAGRLVAFTQEQLHALGWLALQAHGYGFGIGLVFFGVACLARGWLIYVSGFLPRALGALMALAGVSYLVNSAALLLWPSLASMLFPRVLVPAFVGEFAFALWLAIKGVDRERWVARHADAAR